MISFGGDKETTALFLEVGLGCSARDGAQVFAHQACIGLFSQPEFSNFPLWLSLSLS